MYREGALREGALPVYHVHGYVPAPPERGGSKPDEIVFTEDQYHRTAQDVYSWSNLIQLHAMTRSVGLMIGLSLADRNMRRLLDATTRAPMPGGNYALLQRRRTVPPTDPRARRCLRS